MPTKPTKTINRLHFNDLDPLRFEDLCLNLILRSDNWKELNHPGRSGTDGGVDIEAIKEIDDNEYHVAVQCKRFIKITKGDLDKIVSKIQANGKRFHQLILIISCDISKSNLDYFREIASAAGIIEVRVWAASIIEAMLYKDFKDLLFVYFGVKVDSKQRDNAVAVRYRIKMEKRMLKDFLIPVGEKADRRWHEAIYDPSLRFVSSRIIVHSIDDDEYPNASENAEWFRTHFYDFYHNGLELWLGAAIGHQAIIDKEGNWEPIQDFRDLRLQDSQYKVRRVKMIGRIPFTNIIDYKIDGDGYYNEPHLYCRFNYENGPYEEVYYKTYGDPEKEIADWELPKDKRIAFPPCKNLS